MKIKIYAKFWAMVPVMVFCLSSCTDFLTLTPVNRTEEDGYYSSGQRIDQSVVGAYVDLRRALLNNHAFLMYGEARAGDLDLKVDYLNYVKSQQLKANKFEIKQLTDWGYFYDVVSSANDVLNIIGTADGDALTEDRRKLYKGEALALKSMAYFYLVRIWGDIPSAEAADFGQKLTAAAALDRAVSYAREAIPLLPWTLLNDDGIESPTLSAIRFNKTSATMLLAQQELWRGKGTEAYSELQKLFVDGSVRTGFSLSMGKDRLVTISQTPLNGAVVSIPVDKISSIYSAEDKRLGNLFTFPTGQNYATLIVKDQSTLELLKISELNLLLSEAAWRANNLEDARKYLIQASVGAAEDYSLLTEDTFGDALLLERQRMLIGTGQRFFDLIRFGKVSSFVPGLSEDAVQRGAAHWPLSTRSMLDNSLSQNSYWSN